MKPISAALAAITASFCSLTALAQPIDITLRLAEKVPMSQLAAEVTDPTSPRYGVFYTPEEIRSVAGPDGAQYSALLETLRSDGFTVVSESKTHLLVTVRADHRTVEKAFATQLAFTRGSGLHHALVTPTIPSKYALVESVAGLDNTHKFRPHFVLPLGNQSPGGSTSAPTQPGLLPSQIKTAYQYDAIYKQGVTGKGQDIAIATYMGFYIQDVKDYYSSVGLSPVPQIDEVMFNGTPTFDDASAAETQLDSEFTGMIAPGANIHVFASAQNSDAGELAMFTAILDDGRSKQVNYSWGMCETQVDASHRTDMDAVYARAAAQGVSIQVATGDSGSDDCGDGSTAADWPASNPNVVAVGGTTLTLAADNSIASEVGWSGSGGGVSKLYPQPSFQSNLPAAYKSGRALPDVAFNADPNSGEAIWTHYGSSTASWLQIGGTSMAAPQWTGLIALVNEARATAGKSTLPSLDSILYAAQPSDLSLIMNDILTGSNGAFQAGPGWDAVTGLGSPKAGALFTYLLAH